MAKRNSIAVGLASGLGNAVFMLPTVKALKLQGHRISLYVQTDFETVGLFRRCIYADEILEPPATLNGHKLICGQWRPAAWSAVRNVTRMQVGYPYTMPEWKSNLRLAGRSDKIDISDWCDGLDRNLRWDVGIVPGSKEGVWLRKRYPGMKDIAAYYLAQGVKVGVFGLPHDGVSETPGEAVMTENIALLADVLAGCRVVIGTDSGPTHLASSLGIPVVVIYTATSEIKGEPVGRHNTIVTAMKCRPCQSIPRWYGCMDWKCREIDPDHVIQAANEFLEQSKDQ